VTDHPRLIEHVFPLKQASIDSVHEKNVRHGHISTLHIWPARRPLAACRAALVATLLADPENDEDRRRLLEKLGGKVVQSVKKKRMPGGRLEETKSEETVGGILHWGLESAPDLGWFRDEIRKAFGGRAPRVMDPFAGGGAIPLEAMRLGCEVTAADLNPVAWMLLKCTLEYPQRLVGEKRPLPEFARKDRELLEKFFAAQGMRGAAVRTQLERLGLDGGAPLSFAALFEDDRLLEAGLSWHVRAWGREVLRQVRSELGRFYPMIDGKPTVAYLWARTVRCKGCRATLPLLKTRWLCKKDHKRVLLAMQPNDGKTGVVFDVRNEVPGQGGNAAQRREHDKRLGEGTMTRSGAKCPCCPAMMTMEDIRLEGRAGRLDAVMTAVVVDGPEGKEFRRPEPNEIEAAGAAAADLEKLFADIPYGLPNDPTPRGGNGASRAFSVGGYGLDTWSKLFTPRQLVAIGTLVCATRRAAETIRDTGEADSSWVEALWSYLALALDRAANYMSTLFIWDNVAGEVPPIRTANHVGFRRGESALACRSILCWSGLQSGERAGWAPRGATNAVAATDRPMPKRSGFDRAGVRSRTDGSSVLRRYPVLRSDGFLLRLAP
jgi:adenine-specific DNA methylase